MAPLAASGLIPSLVGAGIAAVHGLVGVVLALFLPGYAITAAALPTRMRGFWERLVLSLGLSISVAAFSGLVLTWTPFGLRPTSWLAALGTVTAAAAGYALVRRGRPWVNRAGRYQLGIRARVPLLIGTAALIGAGAIAVAYQGVIDEPQPAYTQLWLLPATPAHSIRIGVKNMEPAPVRYRLVVGLANQEVEEWSPIDLNPGQSWQVTTDLPATLTAAPVHAYLYRLDAPQTVYRWVRLAQDLASGSGT